MFKSLSKRMLCSSGQGNNTGLCPNSRCKSRKLARAYFCFGCFAHFFFAQFVPWWSRIESLGVGTCRHDPTSSPALTKTGYCQICVDILLKTFASCLLGQAGGHKPASVCWLNHHCFEEQEAVLKATAVRSPLPVISPIPPCPPCLPQGPGGAGGQGGLVAGGVRGRGQGIFHPLCHIYCTTTWCFALKGLRTIKHSAPGQNTVAHTGWSTLAWLTETKHARGPESCPDVMRAAPD